VVGGGWWMLDAGRSVESLCEQDYPGLPCILDLFPGLASKRQLMAGAG
jgi:hypothetical protein